MRRHRSDGNQTKIVNQARRLGISVAITSQVGNGFTDAVMGYEGKNYLFEIKDPEGSNQQKRLTPKEQEFKDKWKGQYNVVESIEDICKIIGIKLI